jgi:hypothetical protein
MKTLEQRLLDHFPGLLTDEEVDGADVVEFLSRELRPKGHRITSGDVIQGIVELLRAVRANETALDDDLEQTWEDLKDAYRESSLIISEYIKEREL